MRHPQEVLKCFPHDGAYTEGLGKNLTNWFKAFKIWS